MRFWVLFLIPALFLTIFSGCEIMPVTRYKPVLENPFPQLATVAVIPFENRSDDGSVDGAYFARLYAEEVQKIPGFIVISVRTVQEKMVESGITSLSSIEDIRLLAKILGVDVVVVGRVNNYSSYTPQRLGLTVEWYAANRFMYPVPAGYGLPWGTPEEEHIPNKILSSAERELARAQLETQTPDDLDSDIAYLRYLQEKRQRELLLLAQKNNPNGSANTQNTSNGMSQDEDMPDQQTEQYLQIQQNVVDNQLAYAFGGQPSIPQSLHNMRIDSRNAQVMKQKIAELLQEEELDETGRPVTRPVLSELGRSDWTDRSREQDKINNEMHRTNKPPIEGAFASYTQYAGYAIQNNQGMPNQSFQPGMPGFAPQLNNGLNNGLLYGVLVRQPSNVAIANAQGIVSQTPGIFITFGPDGRVNGAFSVDPATGMVQSPIPLSNLGLQPYQLATTVPQLNDPYNTMPGMIMPNGQVALEPPNFPGLPKNWPDSRGLIPDGPQPEKPKRTVPSDAPVFSLTKQYNATDVEFTQALADYHFLFRDDKFVGGWGMLLTERESFITVCCRMHLWEMFSERGGARKAEKVTRTWKTWYSGRRPY